MDNQEIDVIIIDNFVDMSTMLSYPKDMSYKDSPILLRFRDFDNYDEYFTRGEELTVKESIFYFEEVIEFFHKKVPNASIYFIGFPYNTFSNNPMRITKGENFEKLFQSKIATVLPSPHVPIFLQIEDNPSHFNDLFYISLAGYIHFNEQLKFTKNGVRH